MSSKFIPEHKIYQYLSQVGIKTPRHVYIDKETDIERAAFKAGEPVVMKGMAEDLWHKSDAGALIFCDFEAVLVKSHYAEMSKTVGKKFKWSGVLLCEKINFRSAKNAPSEIFVSLQRDRCCGAIISFGFGGLLTEEWARELKQSLLVWPASVYTPDEAMQELEAHWLGKILLGKLRQEKPLISRANLHKFLISLWQLDELMHRENISLLEINPFVVDSQGDIIALDGVGTKGEEMHKESCPVPLHDDSLLNPTSIALVGVSARAGNIGGLILENIRQSLLAENKLTVIKSGMSSFAGIRCIPDASALLHQAVDILIMALPAKNSMQVIESICEQGGGAEVIYIVAGGIGDGGDSHAYGKRLSSLLEERRENNLWCPVIIGPNGLGMLISPLRLNTLFIPQRKLNINFNAESPVALISQSGAFLITRLSRHSNLSLKYGFSIGNQLDMKLSDFMALMERDKSVKVIGIYVEGFTEGDVCAVAKLVTSIKKENRHVILYKGGRSELGQSAAAGHTGAMTGDYFIQKRLLLKAGAVLVESFNQFNAVLKWFAAYPNMQTLGKLAIITNAGYETVGSVDILGDNDSDRLYKLKPENSEQLSTVLRKYNLQDLVAPVNPLDLTPMADERVYFDCVESMIDFGAGVVILGLVPLSEQLDTHLLTQAEAFAIKLKQIAVARGRIIGIIIDAGVPYQEYKAVFERQGLPVFDGMDMAVLGLNVLERRH